MLAAASTLQRSLDLPVWGAEGAAECPCELGARIAQHSSCVPALANLGVTGPS